MSQFFGGQLFGGDFFAAASTAGEFYNGPFFNGGFVGEVPGPDAGPTIDVVDGRARDKTRREFEARQDALKADLRRIIEHAFEGRKEGAQANPAKPLAKPEKRKMAQSILAQTDFGPMQVSLAEIIRQIDEYQRALVIEQMRRDEEDAILALMLAS